MNARSDRLARRAAPEARKKRGLSRSHLSRCCAGYFLFFESLPWCQTRPILGADPKPIPLNVSTASVLEIVWPPRNEAEAVRLRGRGSRLFDSERGVLVRSIMYGNFLIH